MRIESVKFTERSACGEYPYVGIHSTSDLQVLFFEKGRGVVVRAGHDYELGEYSHNWAECNFTRRDYGKIDLTILL